MFIGDNRWHRKYICDKCEEEIPFIKQKGFVGIHRYSMSTHRNYEYTHNFDLCASCEKKFRGWLNTKEVKTLKEIIESIPKYEEE